MNPILWVMPESRSMGKFGAGVWPGDLAHAKLPHRRHYQKRQAEVAQASGPVRCGMIPLRARAAILSNSFERNSNLRRHLDSFAVI